MLLHGRSADNVRLKTVGWAIFELEMLLLPAKEVMVHSLQVVSVHQCHPVAIVLSHRYTVFQRQGFLKTLLRQ